MTEARVSQVPVEVLRTNLAVSAQVSQVAVEVLRPNAALGMSCNVGTFALTGQTAALKYKIAIAAASGNFTLSGQAAGSLLAYVLSGGTGAFVLTGGDATYFQPGSITADVGYFTLSGASASLRYDRHVFAAAGGFVLSGKAAARSIIFAPDVTEVTVLGYVTNFLYQDIISDPFFARESVKAIWALNVSQTVAATDAATYAFHPGALIEEVFALADAHPRKWNLIRTVAESTLLRDALSAAFPVSVADTATIASAAAVVRAVLVLEQLRLIDLATVAGDFYVQVVDALVANDALRRFLGGALSETIGASGVTSYAPILGKVLTETVNVADALTKKLIVRIIAQDGVNLDDATPTKWLFKPILTDNVDIEIGYIQPNGAFTTWAVNTRTGAVTEYQNYEFNSFANLGHKYLGAASSGLYELNGDDDDGTDIIAQIKSGLAQFGGSKYSSFKAAYLGMRGDGNIILKLETGDGNSYTYQTVIQDMQSTKVRLGKGLRARYFSFELISTGPDFDLDTVEFIPLVAQRRV